jgi:hypothetical protein
MPHLKTVIILFAICLSTFISVSALAKEKEVEGYYIRRASTKKVRTTFYFTGKKPSVIDMQKGVDFMDDRGKKRLLLPTEADEFGFIYKGDTILMRSVYDNLHAQTDLFLQVLADGVVSCYTYYSYSYSATGLNSPPVVASAAASSILQHSNGELVTIRSTFFRKDMSDFFADCPALVEKINKGPRKTITEYAKEYNRTCR